MSPLLAIDSYNTNLGITHKDHKTKEWIRHSTRLEDVARSWGEERSIGRPRQRWYDEIKLKA